VVIRLFEFILLLIIFAIETSLFWLFPAGLVRVCTAIWVALRFFIAIT
jgi:hypothetical protein